MRWAIAIFPMLFLCGCKTRYVATELHTTDTISITDTLYIERMVTITAARTDSNTTSEVKAAKIKITDYDSVGKVSRVTDIDLTSEKHSKSGGSTVESVVATEVEQAGHTEQSGSATDYERNEIRVPYVPWWVTVAGIVTKVIIVIVMIRFVSHLKK